MRLSGATRSLWKANGVKMTTEIKNAARNAEQRRKEAQTHPQRTVEAAELQARSLARIADLLDRLAGDLQ